MRFELQEAIGVPIRVKAPLSQYTTLRVGGPARYLCVVRSASQLATALLTAKIKRLPCQVLGQGSNVLFSDGGFDGLVIVYRADQVEVDGRRIRAEGGARYGRLVETAARRGLKGLEFAAGIPGTIGGALHGNAGAFGRSIGDVLVEAVLLSPDGRTRRRAGPEELGLGYRRSRLGETGELVESLTLELEEGEPSEIWSVIEAHLERRSQRVPPSSIPSAGSFFKNLPPPAPGAHRVAAGKLLDECGCKGLSVGDAQVYEHHANIIVNRGRATARQILRLAEEMQRRVRERFDIQLVPEVKIFAGAEGTKR